VIYKSKTGIVLHDLRNDWVDDLYLLWGAALLPAGTIRFGVPDVPVYQLCVCTKGKDGITNTSAAAWMALLQTALPPTKN
jgi:hypothetical protein